MNKKILLLLLPIIITAGIISPYSHFNNTDKALKFINALQPGQKAKTLFPFDELSRSEWSFLPVSMIPRKGILLRDLSAVQKENLNELLQAYLSKEGYTKAKNIIGLENVLRELENNNLNRDPELYALSFYGMPGKDSIWGWKFEGHHISLNFTIVKNRVAFAPFFFGANPAEVKEGTQKGFRALKNEEDDALLLVNMLSAKQREKAIFRLQSFMEIVTSNASEIAPLKPAGILVKDMNTDQQKQLNKLLGTYLSSLPPSLADMRKKKIALEDMNDLRFGWAGATETGKPHYYRIQGKTFLIEFDNTQNNANHIHTVWRDFNGDFGRDLLKEHYHNSKHRH